MVSAVGFDPTASRPRTVRSAKLSYALLMTAHLVGAFFGRLKWVVRTVENGRDGRILTGGLLLPRQAL